MESKGQGVFSGSTIYALKFLKQFATWKWFNSQGRVTILLAQKTHGLTTRHLSEAVPCCFMNCSLSLNKLWREQNNPSWKASKKYNFHENKGWNPRLLTHWPFGISLLNVKRNLIGSHGCLDGALAGRSLEEHLVWFHYVGYKLVTSLPCPWDPCMVLVCLPTFGWFFYCEGS